MSYCVPRRGSFRYSSAIFLVLLLLSIIGLLRAPLALAFNATALGDIGNVTVMEVSGDYGTYNMYGNIDMAARREIAKEFYRTHGDDYDFLVIFTNFNFAMPSGAKAFFSPAKNDVRGLGLELYDYTYAYSPTGAYLARLQGTIDMARITSHVLDPADPEFDDTLRTLTHEMLHRWGAYVHFQDGEVESDALLGLDSSHWSFLLDTGGSTLYGNNWRENGDGTFTTVAPEQVRSGEVIGRLFSPLELYLMGLLDKDQVPPLLLIDAPGIDCKTLPALGVTLPGTAKIVTIDDIIAVEGARVPAAAQSRKELSMAFIYAVTPGSWTESDAQNLGDLAAINRLQTEWEKRFSILTDGRGMMRTALPVAETVESNPGITVPTVTPAPLPGVNSGIDWLMSRQSPDGSWQDQPGTAPRDTAVAVAALKPFPVAAAKVSVGNSWLVAATPGNSDYLARKLLGLDSASVAEIVTRQNNDGGWGSAPGFGSNPIDTALVLQALIVRGGADNSVLPAAVNYLHGRQNPDGGWSPGFGVSMVQPTAQILMALNSCRRSIPLEPTIADGLVWLTARQNTDGGFGNSPSTIVDTAVALQALKATGGSLLAANQAVNYLLAGQASTGSWNGSSFQTALAVAALYTGQVAADLAVETKDITITPATVSVVPTTVTVAVTVRNLGSNAVAQARVSLFVDDPAFGKLIGEKSVDVPGNGGAPVNFAVTISESGLHSYYVVVDGDNQVSEANEWNNAAVKTLAANMAPPTVGFALAASAGSEAVNNVPLAVTLSYPWAEPITVNYAVNAASSAVPAVDYVLAAGPLTFAVDQTVRTVNLSVSNDLVAEIDKTVIIDLTNPSLGTLGTSRHTYTIRDDEAPVVTITSPPAGLIGQNQPQLLYTTTGSNVVAKVDGAVVAKVSGSPLDTLADGTHFVEVTASNSYGLITTTKINFTVDVSLPTIVVNWPLPGAVTNGQPRLDFTVTSTVTTEVRLDGVVVNKRPGDILGPLAEGMHTLEVNAWNAAGSRSSVPVVFRVDARSPVVAIAYPVNEFIREVNPRLLCQVDESGEVVVWLDGVKTALVIGEPMGPLGSGTHHLRVTVTDAAGNVGSDEVNFAVTTGIEAAYAPAHGWPGIVEGAYGGSAVDKAGNVYVVTRKAAEEFNIIKFDAAGNRTWEVTASSFFNIMGAAWVDVTPKDLAVDSQGNIYIVGWGKWLSSNYGFLAKFDGNGRQVNHIVLDTGILYGDIYVYSVHVDDSGQVYISGNTEYDPFTTGHGVTSMFVAKYNGDLNLLYGRGYGGSNSQENFYFVDLESMTVDAQQNVYVTGTNGSNRLLVWKLNPDLTRSGLEIVGPDTTYGRAVDIDLFGNIYVAGQDQSGGALWKYSPDGQLVDWQGGVSPLAASSLVANGDGSVFLLDYNGYIRKFDHDLSLLWAIGLGTDFDSKLVKDNNGQLVVGGTFTGSSTIASITKISDPRDPEFTFDAAVFHINSAVASVSGFLESGNAAIMESAEFDLLSFTHNATDGRWQMTIAGLPEGESRVAVSVTSGAGSKRVYETRVVVDTLVPNVVITSPIAGSSWSSQPVLVYTVSEGEVKVSVNGVDVTKRSGYPLDCLVSGENRIRVQSIDSAGNVGVDDITIFASGAAVGEYPLALGQIRKLGTAGDQTVVATGQDAAGNLYVFGDTTQNFPGYPGGGRELYVAKYAPSGNLLNLWQFGSPADDFGAGFAVTDGGEFLVAYNVDKLNTAANSMMIAKYAANGSQIWSNPLDSGADDQINDLEIDAAGNVFACGYTQGRLHNKRYGGGVDYFLVKYSAAGSRVWTILSSAPGYEALADIELAADGFVYATSAMTDDGAMSLFKFNTTGGLVWKQDYRYTNHYLRGKKLVIGQEGSLYTLTESNHSSYYFVTKHDAQGNLIKEAVGQSPSIKGLGLSVDAHAGVYVTGYVNDPYGIGWSFDGNQNFGDEDIFIAKYAATDLRKLWVRQFGDVNGQQGVEMIFNRANGQFYLAGVTDGKFGGASYGGQDVFIANLVWPERSTGPGLTIANFPSPTKEKSLLITGTTTPGAIIDAALDASAGSAVVLSPVVQHNDGSWQFTISNLVANAANDLTVHARDAVGTISERITITVDTIPPLLHVNTVVSPTVQASQVITGSLDASAILTVKVNQAPARAIDVIDGVWSYSAVLTSGSNSLIFAATDAAGNEIIRTTAITLLPPKLTISPATLQQGESAMITLMIEQFDAASNLQIKLVQDIAGDGSPNGDPLARLFFVKDGVASSDPNVPGDEDDLVNGRIVTTLKFNYCNDVQMAPGNYLFLADPIPHTVTVPLKILATSQNQTIHGYVLDSLNNPRSGATVQLLDKWGNNHGYAFTDAVGHYLFNVPTPGEFVLLPTLDAFVFDKSRMVPHALASGQHLRIDLPMVAGTYKVDGQLLDAGTMSPVMGGVLVRAESSQYVAAPMTRVASAYQFYLPDGDYDLFVDAYTAQGPAPQGYLGARTPLGHLSVSAVTAGNNLLLHKATAQVCGQVRDAANMGVAGLVVEAISGSGSGRFATAVTDTEGSYCVGLSDDGVWQITMNDAANQALGYVGTGISGVSANTGSLSGRDLSVLPVVAWLEGVVLKDGAQPVAGVPVRVTSTATGVVVNGRTVADGRYRLGVHAGVWEVTISPQAQGFDPVLPVAATVATGETAIRNFSVTKPGQMVNTIVVTKATYDTRKKVLNIEATSDRPNAQLQLDGYGPMTFSKLFKGKYYWAFSENMIIRPATVSVSGPEGAVTAQVK